MGGDQQYILGFEQADFWQLAEMLAILFMALVVIFVLYRYIYPMAFRQLGTLFSQPPNLNFSSRKFLLRLPLLVLFLGAMYWLSKTYLDEEAAQLFLFGGIIGIVIIPGTYIFHNSIIPWWRKLPQHFTTLFSSQAPGYQPLRTLSLRQRLDISGLIILIVAGLVLILRTVGWINPTQLIFAGLPVLDHLRDIHTSGFDLGTKQKILNLTELVVMGALFAAMVFPFLNAIMRLIPSFNIKLKFIDHFGLMVACVVGVALGYSPIFF